MKLFFLIFSLLFVGICFCEEKTESAIEDEDELNVTPPQKLKFTKPNLSDNHHFAMYFTSPSNLAEILVQSEAKKDGVEENLAKYNGIWSVEVPQSSAIEEDYALVLKSKARHAAVSAKLNRPFDFSQNQLVVQYEVKFQNGQECGGAYVKLLSETGDLNLKNFHDKTLYTIMFGPDRCGNDNKIHFIFQHKHPKTGKYEEKHAKKSSSDLDRYFTDKKTHLYTLVINSDNTFEIYVDQSLINSGNLLKDFEPPVNPPKEVDDPSDTKPIDWDDTPKIEDPNAVKPDDWDETAPEYIEDESAVKPDGWLEHELLTVPDEKSERPKDWDDEMDGEWEAPRIDNPVCKDAPGCGPWKAPKIKNPKYKGKWSPPMIDNPKYKGVWKARRIPNADYFEDSTPYKMTPIGAIGLELWSMSDEIVFDNFLIADSKKAADNFAAETWEIKKDSERRADPNSQSVVDAIREATSERPWLWIVIILVIVLPIVLIIVYCCRSSSSSDRNIDLDRLTRGMHKKDDDIVEEDDDVGDDDDKNETKPEAAGDDGSQVNVDDDDELVKEPLKESHAGGPGGDETTTTTTTKADLESESENESHWKEKSSSELESSSNSPSNGQTVKKRRARKE